MFHRFLGKILLSFRYPPAQPSTPNLLWGGGDGALARMHEDGKLPWVPVIILASQPESNCLYQIPTPLLVEHSANSLAPGLLAKTIRRLVEVITLPEEQQWTIN